MSSLCNILGRLAGVGDGLFKCSRRITAAFSLNSVRNKCRDVDIPSNVGGAAGQFRRIVLYPDAYTVKPLDVRRLGGRDPISGRLVVKGIGGGIKRKYHWIDFKRVGPEIGRPITEKVVRIMVDWCRTSRIALVASGDTMKYILATENMKPGDIIKTSQHIPRIPVSAKEGDAYPLGALAVGTVVNNVEKYAGRGGWYAHAAGTCATIVRKDAHAATVVVQLPSKRQVSLSQRCMATVGRLSNVDHENTPIGSAQKNRELGNRPRSGLWHRKDGRHGRKIRNLPPVVSYADCRSPTTAQQLVQLSLKTDQLHHSKL